MDAGGFDPDDGGGYISDGGDGGFVPDEGGEGGFMPDEDDEEDMSGSKSNANRQGEDTESGEPRRIPLRKLPGILSSLNLPSDEDVLAVFRASASGWTEPNRYATREEEEENRLIGGGVELKDFRAVCAALMGPDEGPQSDQDDDDDGDGDVYKGEGDDSSLSEITEDEYEEQANTSKDQTKSRGGKGKGGGRGKKRIELEDNGKIKLNARQREVVNDLWSMLKPEEEQQKRGGHILGRDEVRRKVRDLGEMWTEDEVSCCKGLR